MGIIHKYFTLRFDPYAFPKVEASKNRNFYLRDMKKSKFSETQIAGILKQYGQGVSEAGLCRDHGTSTATLYNWRARVETCVNS
jgi:hypothetical protein